MNGKMAKKLRRIAAQVTVGQPWQDYTMGRPSVRIVRRMAAYGEAVESTVPITGTIRLKRGCTKQVYQSLKKTVRDVRADQFISL